MSSVQAIRANDLSSWSLYATEGNDWVNKKFCKVYPYGTKEPKVYTEELSSGDLYLRESKNEKEETIIESPSKIAFKSGAIFVGTVPYMLGMMGVNLLKIVVDISSIFWRIIPQFIKEISTKKCIAATGNLLMSVIWEVPYAIMQDIWRVIRSPLYAAGVALAGLYGVVSPYEGRKWIGKIEGLWHEGASYKMDFRYRTPKDYPLSRLISDVAEGKILFLAWCMQKRGNVRDQRLGKDVYIRV